VDFAAVKLVYLYGPPAVGKLTVAQELAKLTGFKLFHNHLTFDLMRSVFEFGTEPFRRLMAKVRLDVFEEAARAGVPGIVFTFVYARGVDDEFIAKVLEIVGRYGGEVDFVQLYCDPKELLNRVLQESRRDYAKIATVGQLEHLLANEDLFSSIPFQDGLRIDNTDLAPEEAARRIVDHYRLD
jgi:hypothetical protein